MSGIADAVLFDLDGTLADTAPDLIAAANRLREQLGRAPVPEAAVRNAVSKGGAAILRAAFVDAPELAPSLLERYLAVYRERIHVHTRLFDCISGALGQKAPELSMAAGYGTSPFFVFSGDDADGESQHHAADRGPPGRQRGRRPGGQDHLRRRPGP